jgi:hypothetical protein
VNASWKATSNLSFVADLYRSNANRPEGGTDAFVTAGLESTTPYNQNTITWSSTPGGLPNIAVTLPNRQDFAAALAAGTLTNDNWTAHYVGLGGYSIHDAVTGGTLDGTLKFDGGVLQNLQFGLAYTLRDKTRDDFNNDWTGGSSQYNFYTTPAGANPITFGSLGANVVTIARLPNYMQGRVAHFQRRWRCLTSPRPMRLPDGQPNLYSPGAPNYDFNLTLPVQCRQFHWCASARRPRISKPRSRALAGRPSWPVRALDKTAGTAVNDIISVTVANSVPTDPAIVVYAI